eukprot:TRINITY_DN19592_c0_g1_i1.p1 TRINITY_DN19592_c0_g1~~TRINITY_DN19592_c0_g1_i1.p1  ORF type:complete len:112 (+),score=19.40 TRINITY_DN19592_c0_g1_i1:433-768(+)
MSYQHIEIPPQGEQIRIDNTGIWHIPAQPIIAYIDGDGVGQDISPCMRNVVNHAVQLCYQGQRQIHWMEVFNGEKAAQLYDGDWFPQETIHAVRQFKIAIKGPLTLSLIHI